MKKMKQNEKYLSSEEYDAMCKNVTKRVYENQKQRKLVHNVMFKDINEYQERQRTMS